MFSVKATYRNEVRKFTFPGTSFPSYDEIWMQLLKVFHMSNDVYLSQLVFSPYNEAKLLVGIEVHNQAQYKARIAPFTGTAWPRGLLKFTVVDKTNSADSLAGDINTETTEIDEATAEQIRRLGQVQSVDNHFFEDATRLLPQSSAPSQTFPTLPSVPSFLPFDDETPAVPTLRLRPATAVDAQESAAKQNNRTSMVSTVSTSTQQSCCSVSASKEEMKELMNGFLQNCNRIVSSLSSQDSSASTPRQDVLRSVPMDQDEHAPQPAQQTYNNVAEVPLRIPGSFAPPPTMAPEPTSTSSYAKNALHPAVWCNYCRQSIRGLRYKCQRCEDYDLCEACILDKNAMKKHQNINWRVQHNFRAMEPPSATPATTAAETNVPAVDANAPPKVHTGIVCDVCNDTIIGLRHKCLDCPDYDLCDDCKPNAAFTHDPHHEFFVIEEPGRVFVHTVFSGNESPRRNLERFSQAASARVSRVQPVDNVERSSQATPVPVRRDVVHNATCNMCSARILNDRYKCLDCPDFDTCNVCYAIMAEQHPRHVFVKLSESQNLLSADPARMVAHAADCDGCGKPIHGIRYKCMHPSCPDYDLCADCEAMPIPVHPDTHPMLKMRNPATVVPTVYRVGGTELIARNAAVVPTQQVAEPVPVATAEASVMAEEPVVEKVEAGVQGIVTEPEHQVITEVVPSPQTITPSVIPVLPSVPDVPIIPSLPTPPCATSELPMMEIPVVSDNGMVCRMEDSALLVPPTPAFANMNMRMTSPPWRQSEWWPSPSDVLPPVDLAANNNFNDNNGNEDMRVRPVPRPIMTTTNTTATGGWCGFGRVRYEQPRVIHIDEVQAPVPAPAPASSQASVQNQSHSQSEDQNMDDLPGLEPASPSSDEDTSSESESSSDSEWKTPEVRARRVLAGDTSGVGAASGASGVNERPESSLFAGPVRDFGRFEESDEEEEGEERRMPGQLPIATASASASASVGLPTDAIRASQRRNLNLNEGSATWLNPRFSRRVPLALRTAASTSGNANGSASGTGNGNAEFERMVRDMRSRTRVLEARFAARKMAAGSGSAAPSSANANNASAGANGSGNGGEGSLRVDVVDVAQVPTAPATPVERAPTPGPIERVEVDDVAIGAPVSAPASESASVSAPVPIAPTPVVPRQSGNVGLDGANASGTKEKRSEESVLNDWFKTLLHPQGYNAAGSSSSLASASGSVRVQPPPHPQVGVSNTHSNGNGTPTAPVPPSTSTSTDAVVNSFFRGLIQRSKGDYPAGSIGSRASSTMSGSGMTTTTTSVSGASSASVSGSVNGSAASTATATATAIAQAGAQNGLTMLQNMRKEKFAELQKMQEEHKARRERAESKLHAQHAQVQAQVQQVQTQAQQAQGQAIAQATQIQAQAHAVQNQLYTAHQQAHTALQQAQAATQQQAQASQRNPYLPYLPLRNPYVSNGQENGSSGQAGQGQGQGQGQAMHPQVQALWNGSRFGLPPVSAPYMPPPPPPGSRTYAYGMLPPMEGSGAYSMHPPMPPSMQPPHHPHSHLTNPRADLNAPHIAYSPAHPHPHTHAAPYVSYLPPPPPPTLFSPYGPRPSFPASYTVVPPVNVATVTPSVPVVPAGPAQVSIPAPVAAPAPVMDETSPSSPVLVRASTAEPVFVDAPSSPVVVPVSAPASPQVSVLPPTPAPAEAVVPVVPTAPAAPVHNSTELRAVFVSDNNIADGQIFPAGAEFVKSWNMRNNGDVAWPEGTEIYFVAGDRMAAGRDALNSYRIGRVAAGESVDVNVGDMKAPDVPGKYVSYWRLRDGEGKPFGASVWCDITVAEPEIFNSMTISEADRSVRSSLSASSIIMPTSAPAPTAVVITNPEITEPQHSMAAIPAYMHSNSTPAPSSPTFSATSTLQSQDDVSDTSSFIDSTSYNGSGDEDEDLIDWDETHSQRLYAGRQHRGRSPSSQGDVEYVML